MPAKSKTYNTVPGFRSISDPELFGSRVVQVKRNGRGLNKVAPATVVGNREYRETIIGIQVSNTERFITGEKIWI